MTESEYSGFEEVTSLIYNRGYYDGLKVGREQEKVSIRGNIKKAREEVEKLDLNNYGDNLYQFQAKCIEILDKLMESEGE